MSTTRQLINYLKLQAEGWNRAGEKGLLEILNEAQNMLMMQGNQQSIAYRTDQDLPYIATTDGVYEYTLNQATTGLTKDIWRVDGIFVKPNFFFDYDYSNFPNYRYPTKLYLFNGIEYLKWYEIASVDALDNDVPRLRFRVNPKTTTQSFYILAYYKPTQLTSETIPLTLPSYLHMSCLLPTALKLIEGIQNGNVEESMQIIEKRYMPMVQSKLNEGEQGVSFSTERYEF